MNIVDNVHNVLVYDFGTSAIRFGYGGDLRPLFSIPSYSATINQEDIQFGQEWLQKRVPELEVKMMYTQNDNILDRETAIPFIDWTYVNCLKVEPQQWSALFSQPSSLVVEPRKLKSQKALLAEISFEFSNHPQLCFQHDASLACYAHGLHTGVVVDFGWSSLRVVPVLEGHPLRRSVKIYDYGGSQMADILEDYLTNEGKIVKTFLDIKPFDGFLNHDSYDFNPSESQLKFCRKSVLIDMIKNHLKFKLTPDPKETIADYVYYMAGREPIDIENAIKSLSNRFWTDDEDSPSLQKLVADAIDQTPIEIQSKMWETIVTSGGLSKLYGFNDYLENKLQQYAPPGVKPKVIRPMTPEASGSFTVWVGGSIVSSYEQFPSLCITNSEWNEQGERILDMKCL